MRKFIKIILPIILIGFTIYALDWFAVINVKNVLHNVPVLGKIISTSKNETKEVSSTASNKTSATSDKEIKRLKTENLKLKNQVKDLQKQRVELTKTNNDLKAQQGEQQQQQSDQSTQTQQTEKQKTGFKVLATYYADMKPANAVAIMNNLDDDTIIGILSNMDPDQSGKILAAMDPKRAAMIVQKMT